MYKLGEYCTYYPHILIELNLNYVHYVVVRYAISHRNNVQLYWWHVIFEKILVRKKIFGRNGNMIGNNINKIGNHSLGKSNSGEYISEKYFRGKLFLGMRNE